MDLLPSLDLPELTGALDEDSIIGPPGIVTVPVANSICSTALENSALVEAPRISKGQNELCSVNDTGRNMNLSGSSEAKQDFPTFKKT
jgi:hypothetical protein